MIARAVVVALLFASPAFAQDARETRVMAAVRSAMTPALPFPASDDAGALPANGDTEALWMVRPIEPGDHVIEVIANPLNSVNQLRAARAMAQIENNIEAAQRKATAQYDRALAEAKRTGKSQDVDGITLADEGVAGAKIDADSHVEIEVLFNQPAYKFDMPTSIQPSSSTQVSIPGAVAVISVPSNTYRDERLGGDRYAEAQAQVFLGRLAAPEIHKRADNTYEVSASPAPAENAAPLTTLVIRIRGNEVLMADLLRKTNWNAVLELLQ